MAALSGGGPAELGAPFRKGPGVVCLPFKSQGFQRDCFHLIKSPREWEGGGVGGGLIT